MYLHRYPGYGGIENVTTYLSNFLVKYGVSVSIFSFEVQAEKELLLFLDSKIKVYHANDSDDKLSIMRTLESIIETDKIDIVVYQDSYAPIEDYILGVLQKTGVKLCIVEHNVPDCAIRSLKQAYSSKIKWYPTKQWLTYPYRLLKLKKEVRKRHMLLYNWSDKYILLSEKFYPILERLIGNLNESKIWHINNPITIKAPLTDNFNKEKICLFCGRLTAQKGIKYLMDIWCRVEEKNISWKLVIVGDGPLNDYVRLIINERHLKNVILEGFKSDPSPYYSRASILCMCSIFEGWMLSLVEAMVYGCVPITFNSYEAASDIISNGADGILIKPFKVDDYVDNLLKLMNNSGLLHQMSHNAKLSSKRFSIDKIGMEWIHLFNSLKK